MNRHSYLSGLAAAAAAIVPSGVRAQARAIRIGSGSSDQYSLSMFAKDAGFFDRAGLDVDVQRFTQLQTAVQGLAAGELDVVCADVVQIANAINSGIPLGYFAPAAIYTTAVPTVFVCVAKNGTVRSAKDLENGSVAVVALSTQITVGLQQWLKDSGVDATKVKLVELPFAAMAPAVSRGTVAAAVIAEPFVTQSIDSIRLIGDPMAAIAKNYLLCGMASTHAWITANRDLAKRLTKMYGEAATWANAHPADTAKTLAAYSNIPLATVLAMRRATFTATLSPPQIQPALDMAFKYGQLQKPLRAQSMIIPL